MARRIQAQTPTSALGQFGLLLMLIVARLAPVAYAPENEGIGRLRGLLARRAIDGIAVIGWCFDHIPPRGSAGGATGARGVRESHAHA